MEAFEASRDYLAMERFGSSMRAVSNSGKERARLFSKGADHIDDWGRTHQPHLFELGADPRLVLRVE